jgi:sugar lactone lactonase YvrE
MVMPLEDRQLLTTPTLISLFSLPSSLTYGTPVNLLAKVATNPPSSTMPTGGTVTFISDGTTTLGSSNLVGGSAGLSVKLGAGAHTLTASYSGNGTFAATTTTASAGVIFLQAGNGTFGSTGNGGQAKVAELSNPFGVVVGSSGNIYIADTFSDVIRKVNSGTGVITVVAGTTGQSGYSGDNGPATSAKLFDPRGLALDTSGHLFIADRDNNVIREVNLSTGIITTVAGNHTFGFSGDGGQATAAELGSPSAVAMDSAGTHLFIADTFNFRIREVDLTSGVISTFAGNGTFGFSGDGGQATAAELTDTTGVVVDPNGNVYVSDSDNDVVRKVDTTGVITTIAGTPGQSGFTGNGGPATAAKLFTPWGLALGSTGNLFIADRDNNMIREVNLTSGVISTVAGNGTFGSLGNNGTATAAELSSPRSVAVDSFGNLYVADTLGNQVRLVSAGVGAVPVTVAKAPLTIQANSASRLLGAPNPNFTVTYSGFVNGDTAASLTTQPTVTTTANASSLTGNYPITVSGASSPNYTITFVPGTLTVVPLVTLPPAGTSVVSKVPTGQGNKKAQAFVFHFSNLADASAASNILNYTLTTVPHGKNGKVKQLKLVKVTFDAATGVLTVFPRKPIKKGMRVQLIIHGQPGGDIILTISKGGVISRPVPSATAAFSNVVLKSGSHSHDHATG